jgi:hypothetical protein
MNTIKTYFKNLLAAVLGNGGVKYQLPPGVYRVDEPIVVQGAPTDPGKPR